MYMYIYSYSYNFPGLLGHQVAGLEGSLLKSPLSALAASDSTLSGQVGLFFPVCIIQGNFSRDIGITLEI